MRFRLPPAVPPTVAAVCEALADRTIDGTYEGADPALVRFLIENEIEFMSPLAESSVSGDSPSCVTHWLHVMSMDERADGSVHVVYAVAGEPGWALLPAAAAADVRTAAPTHPFEVLRILTEDAIDGSDVDDQSAAAAVMGLCEAWGKDPKWLKIVGVKSGYRRDPVNPKIPGNEVVVRIKNKNYWFPADKAALSKFIRLGKKNRGEALQWFRRYVRRDRGYRGKWPDRGYVIRNTILKKNTTDVSTSVHEGGYQGGSSRASTLFHEDSSVNEALSTETTVYLLVNPTVDDLRKMVTAFEREHPEAARDYHPAWYTPGGTALRFLGNPKTLWVWPAYLSPHADAWHAFIKINRSKPLLASIGYGSVGAATEWRITGTPSDWLARHRPELAATPGALMEEAFVDAFRAYGGYTEVFKNPSGSELSAAVSASSFGAEALRSRAFLIGKNAYVWTADGGLHEDVVDRIAGDMSSAIPLGIGFDKGFRIVNIVVTDFVEQTGWAGDTSVVEAIKRHPWIRAHSQGPIDIEFHPEWGAQSVDESAAARSTLVSEAFDRPAATSSHIEQYGHRDERPGVVYSAGVNDANGKTHTLRVVFVARGLGGWSVQFLVDGSYAASSRLGIAQTVFATVLDVTRRFVAEHKPTYLTFTTVKERANQDHSGVRPGGRQRLYRALLQRYANEVGAKVFVDEYDTDVSFRLTFRERVGGSTPSSHNEALQLHEHLPIDGKEPWQLPVRDFLNKTITGHIQSDAYAQSEEPGGLGWLKYDKHPELLATEKFGDAVIEFRGSGEPLKYAKYAKPGDLNAMRDEQGGLIYLSDEEMKAAGLATHDQTVVAFHDGSAVGLASNEWGVPGVWVERPWQRKGIGMRLLELLSTRMKIKKLGQATNAGVDLSAKYHKRLVAQALRRGESVPPEVLADYPDLAQNESRIDERRTTALANLWAYFKDIQNDPSEHLRIVARELGREFKNVLISHAGFDAPVDGEDESTNRVLDEHWGDIFDFLHSGDESGTRWLKTLKSKAVAVNGMVELLDHETAELLPPTTWLVHFTDAASSITASGFQYGSNDVSGLGLTVYDDPEEKANDTYAFAFEAVGDSVDEAAANHKYGIQAVVFQSAGIRVHHRTDDEDQVIFDGSSVRPDSIFEIRMDTKSPDSEWFVTAFPKIRGDFRKVVAWVIANHAQYRRKLSSGYARSGRWIGNPTRRPVSEAIRWDRESGLGRVPAQQPSEMRGKGVTVRMRAADFLRLNPPRPEAFLAQDTAQLHKRLDAGEPASPPFLVVALDSKVPEAPVWRVVTHEGRGRSAYAMREDPNVVLDVDVLFRPRLPDALPDRIYADAKAPDKQFSVPLEPTSKPTGQTAPAAPLRERAQDPVRVRLIRRIVDHIASRIKALGELADRRPTEADAQLRVPADVAAMSASAGNTEFGVRELPTPELAKYGVHSIEIRPSSRIDGGGPMASYNLAVASPRITLFVGRDVPSWPITTAGRFAAAFAEGGDEHLASLAHEVAHALDFSSRKRQVDVTRVMPKRRDGESAASAYYNADHEVHAYVTQALTSFMSDVAKAERACLRDIEALPASATSDVFLDGQSLARMQELYDAAASARTFANDLFRGRPSKRSGPALSRFGKELRPETRERVLKRLVTYYPRAKQMVARAAARVDRAFADRFPSWASDKGKNESILGEQAPAAGPRPLPMEPTPDTPTEPGYAYHGTSRARAREIADHGALVTHEPSYGTDQSAWPDGGTKRRSYWASSAKIVWMFIPYDGPGVVLRTPLTAHAFTREGTGDLYTTKAVAADKIEILLADSSWVPLQQWREDDLAVRGSRLAEAQARYVFIGTCVGLDGDAINDMKREDAKEIVDADTMRANCAGFDQFIADMGYGPDFPIENDWAVRYARSNYQGVDCYYMVHSAIEHVWTLDGRTGREDDELDERAPDVQS